MVPNSFYCANAEVCQQYLCGAPIKEVTDLDFTPCDLKLAAEFCHVSMASMEEIARYGALPAYAVEAGMERPRVRSYSPLLFDLSEMKIWAKQFRSAQNSRKLSASERKSLAERRQRVKKEGLVTRVDMIQVLRITYANLSMWSHHFPDSLEQFNGIPAPEFSIGSTQYYKPEVLDWCRKVREYLDKYPMRIKKQPEGAPLVIRSAELAQMIGTTHQSLNRWKKRGIPQCYKDFGCPDLPKPIPIPGAKHPRYKSDEVAKFVLEFKRAQNDYISAVREGKA